MDSKTFDRLQLLAPGTEKYRRILETFERQTLSGVMARILIEDDPEQKRQLETSLLTLLDGPE
jgi:hypothetical protein